MLSPEERERTAYHESGHALLGMLQPGADPVRKISIVPRGMALGVTFQSPEADRYSYDSRYLQGRIIGLLGGRAAEKLVYDDVTTGAESDLEQVTRIARQMVGRWGMSEAIGPVTRPARAPRRAMLFPGIGDGRRLAHTRELVDREVRRIVEECYAEAIAMLRGAPRPARRACQGAARTRDPRRGRGLPVAGVERRPPVSLVDPPVSLVK